MFVLIKGAGDLATGVACRLKACGFLIAMTETAQPTTVRRTVAFSRAVYEGEATVEGVRAVLASSVPDARRIAAQGDIPILIDPEANVLHEWEPDILVDAIIAKRNLNTHITDAPIVIALGPGFTAGTDCHAVIETMRGHFLGKVLYQGSALPNTGVPGEVVGFSRERIIRSPKEGIFHPLASIGDSVKKGEPVAEVDGEPVFAALDGTIRGMLQDGAAVHTGMKSGDIDPRCKKEYCFSVSDKARSIGGGVLEAILHLSGIFSSSG